MLTEIAYYPIFGKPLIMYLGILTLLSLITTISIAVLNKNGYNKIPFKWHYVFATITLILALIHGLFGVLSYF
tara:strand:- start:342 stop:560 length:219 start_codon:yes stop_codon:yes gene_type:complete